MTNKNTLMITIMIAIITFLNFTTYGQIDSTMFGLSRNLTGVKLAKIDAASGTVNDISTGYVSTGFSLSGSSLNPYDNSYTYFGGTTINTLNLSTGTSIASATITTPPYTQYFQYPIFNNSDSTIYGLARGNIYDSITSSYIGVMYLGTINPSTGIVNAISTSSIGSGILLNTGYTVDPYLKIYYFSDNPATIKGIDMYTGAIYSTTNVSRQISNIVYNCNDFNMYGLVSNIYYDTIIDPDSIMPPRYVIDSSSLQLARINMTTGIVTVLSTASVGTMYSLNAGVAIDPINNLYYYQVPGRIIGIDMTSGNIINNAIINNSTGAPYFDLMHHYQNCYTALPRRNNTSGIASISNINYQVFPNPSNDYITIATENSSEPIQVKILNMMGNIVYSNMDYAYNSIDISNLSNAQYIIQIEDKQGYKNYMKFIKN